jgi:AraC-like DNA-binding protein
MMHQRSLFLTPDGLDEVPPPSGAPYGGAWDVDALSVVRGWSNQPMSYGSGGFFVNALAIVLSLTPTRRRTTLNGKVVFEGWTPPGAVRIQRPGEIITTEMLTPFDQVAFYIPISTFHTVLREQHRADDEIFDIADPLWRVDKVIDANFRCAIEAINCKTKASYHYLTNMSRALASHIIYQYLDGSDASARPDGLGSPAIRRAIQFIEANMDRNLSLDEMAVAAEQPTEKFRREFKTVTQMSPHQYLIRRRVDRACELIAASPKPKFADIALECGFADQSHLSTTFRRVLGVSPARFVRQA